MTHDKNVHNEKIRPRCGVLAVQTRRQARKEMARAEAEEALETPRDAPETVEDHEQDDIEK